MSDTPSGIDRDTLPLTVAAAKDAAHQLRARALANGELMKISTAYERIARSEGFRSWSAYLAHLKTAEPQAASTDLVAFNIAVLLSQGDVSLRDPALADHSRFDDEGVDLYNEPLVDLLGLPESFPDQAIPAINQLFDFAHAVARVDESVGSDDVYVLLNRLGGHSGNRPYCLEQNRVRWPNGNYHLVRRSYKEPSTTFPGAASARRPLLVHGMPTTGCASSSSSKSAMSGRCRSTSKGGRNGYR